MNGAELVSNLFFCLADFGSEAASVLVTLGSLVDVVVYVDGALCRHAVMCSLHCVNHSGWLLIKGCLNMEAMISGSSDSPCFAFVPLLFRRLCFIVWSAVVPCFQFSLFLSAPPSIFARPSVFGEQEEPSFCHSASD